MRFTTDESGKFSRETLDAIFLVDVDRRNRRRRLLAENKAQRKAHLAKKRENLALSNGCK